MMKTEVLRKPIVVSSLIHLVIVGAIFGLLLFRYHSPVIKKIEFTVVRPAEPKVLSKPIEEIQIAPPLAKKIETKPRAVFGLNKNTLTTSRSDSPDTSVVVKEGNTIAKAQDTEKLNPEDETALPNPTDEFLVSSMPILVSEVRIPYPKQAREANVEGPVVMELLIDADGKVRKVELISGPGYGLNEAAVLALQTFKFKPAKVDNQSVAVKIRYTYRFVLETR
jgi:TonB family protein